MLLLRYSQRWAKEYLRQNIDLQLVAASISTITGRLSDFLRQLPLCHVVT